MQQQWQQQPIFSEAGNTSSKMDQTQVMVGNFPADVGAQELALNLQRSLGLVDRCKVKRVYGNVPPHAFVQFMSAAVAREACVQAYCGTLKFRGQELKIVACTVKAQAQPSHEGTHSCEDPLILLSTFWSLVLTRAMMQGSLS